MDLELAAACELAALQASRTRRGQGPGADVEPAGCGAAAAALRAGAAAALDGLTVRALRRLVDDATPQAGLPALTLSTPNLKQESSAACRCCRGDARPTRTPLHQGQAAATCAVLAQGTLCATTGPVLLGNCLRQPHKGPELLSLTPRPGQAVAAAPGLSWGVGAVTDERAAPARVAWPELSLALEVPACPAAAGYAVRAQQPAWGGRLRDCSRGCGRRPPASHVLPSLVACVWAFGKP